MSPRTVLRSMKAAQMRITFNPRSIKTPCVFQGRAKCPAKAGLAASRLRHALLAASLTVGNVRYPQALIVETKEIRWKGGAPGSGSMPRISASLGRRRSAHESVLSERVQSG